MRYNDMSDIKRCYNCGKLAAIRKNNITCSFCLEDLRKIRTSISSCIYNSLKYGMNSYVWKYLDYSVIDLKTHIESQFESWMTWKNWGVYNKNFWQDDNKLTWTWQIDHIVPQYNFIFRSLNDQNFKDCWSLNNLRPYSSKENSFKHIKEKKVI